MNSSADPIRALQTRSFGVFEVDFRAGELRKRGIRIRLQEKPLQGLAILLEQPGRVVTREELRKRLWAEDSVDFDHGINIVIAKIREALNDSPSNPRFIETLSRHGYRFIAPVEIRTQIAPRQGRSMLVVLPFDNVGGDPEQNYFTDGLTDEMIAQLGRLNPRLLGVIARTTAMCYRGTNKRADQIGQELGVHYVLEGSVRRSAQRVRITAQLIQVSDQTYLWTETYDRRLEDVLDIQRDVARRIARSLAVELLPAQPAVTQNAVAYEAYLKGRYFWNQRTEEGFAKAIGYFEQAIRNDPNYAIAYTGVSDCFGALGLYGGVPPGQARTRAEQAALSALEIDDTLAEAHTSLAFAKLLFDWDWPGAEREFKKAIELNPNYVTGHHWYGLYLALMGRFDEGLAEMETTLVLDPLSLVMNSHKGWILYFAHRFDAAIEQLHRTFEIGPAFPVARYFLGLAYAQRNQVEKALEQFTTAEELSAGHVAALSGKGMCYGLLAQKDTAMQYVRRFEDLMTRQYVSPYYMACIYIGLGDHERAMEWLEKACAERSGWMALMMVDPMVDGLRSDPRFQNMIRRVGHPA